MKGWNFGLCETLTHKAQLATPQFWAIAIVLSQVTFYLCKLGHLQNKSSMSPNSSLSLVFLMFQQKKFHINRQKKASTRRNMQKGEFQELIEKVFLWKRGLSHQPNDMYERYERLTVSSKAKQYHSGYKMDSECYMPFYLMDLRQKE